jgi:hypothetical protein
MPKWRLQLPSIGEGAQRVLEHDALALAAMARPEAEHVLVRCEQGPPRRRDRGHPRLERGELRRVEEAAPAVELEDLVETRRGGQGRRRGRRAHRKWVDARGRQDRELVIDISRDQRRAGAG